MRLKKRRTKKFGTQKSIYYIIIFFLVIMIGIGYSVFTSNLSLSGSTKISKASWGVRFENYKIDSTSTATSGTVTANSDYTTLTFSGTLSEPGKVLKVATNVANKGTIDAMVSSVVLSGLTTDQKNYLDYQIVYSNGNSVTAKDKLAAGSSASMIVQVTYKNAGTKFLTDQTINLSLTLNYVQADSTAK